MSLIITEKGRQMMEKEPKLQDFRTWNDFYNKAYEYSVLHVIGNEGLEDWETLQQAYGTEGVRIAKQLISKGSLMDV